MNLDVLFGRIDQGGVARSVTLYQHPRRLEYPKQMIILVENSKRLFLLTMRLVHGPILFAFRTHRDHPLSYRIVLVSCQQPPTAPATHRLANRPVKTISYDPFNPAMGKKIPFTSHRERYIEPSLL
jgi:hypothetical protein